MLQGKNTFLQKKKEMSIDVFPKNQDLLSLRQKIDTACFECFLQLLSEAYPDVLNLVQCDQAPAHSGYDLVIPDNVVLLYQPPHSPELNPIERVWEDVKIDLKGDNFANLDELRLAIKQVLEYMTPDWLASLTQYPFIMNALSVSISS
jgi:hypothetical protein